MMSIWRTIWIENKFPKEMSKSVQVPIPKTKCPKTVNDYRRISLCSAAYKPYATWLRNRLREFAGDPELHQAAFTEGRSTDDNIYIVKRIMEEYWNAGRPLYILAIDLTKAFDNVNLNKIEEIHLRLAVPTHIISRVIECIKDDYTRIRWNFQYSAEFKRGKGIKQGCPLSPYLFNLVVQDVLNRVAKDVPCLNMIQTGMVKVPFVLAFADDILILAQNQRQLDIIVTALERHLEYVGLGINNQKSQALLRIPNPLSAYPDSIRLNNKDFKVHEHIKYLGVCLTSTLNRPATTKQRCVNAIRASKVIVNFCKQFKPTWEIGKLMYNTVVAPTILYGTKVAVLTKRNRIQLGRYEKQILKDIWNNCRHQNTVKFNVRKQLRGKTINRRARVGRIQYYGHIKRRPFSHPLKIAYKFKYSWKKEGRPSYTWKDSIEQDFSRYTRNIDWNELAKDKTKLKKAAEKIYEDTDSEITDGEESGSSSEVL